MQPKNTQLPVQQKHSCTVWLWLAEDGKKTTEHFDLPRTAEFVERTLRHAFDEKTVADLIDMVINMANPHLVAWKVTDTQKTEELDVSET